MYRKKSNVWMIYDPSGNAKTETMWHNADGAVYKFIVEDIWKSILKPGDFTNDDVLVEWQARRHDGYTCNRAELIPMEECAVGG